MQSYALHPPNNQALSEEVIGSVVQRAWPTRHNTVGDVCRGRTEPFETDAAPGVPSSRKHTRVSKRSLTLSNEEQQTTEDVDDEEGQATLRYLRDTDIEAYHRERRRQNQERYRRKQRKRAEALESSNQQLRNEIERLHNQRNSIACGISTQETLWSVAVEYFRVFGRGLLLPSTGVSPGGRIVELDFLRSTMAKDLDAGTVRGFELLARNWKVFTQYFKDVHLQLGRLEQIAERSLMATTTTSVTITSHSLRYMFPHLVVDSLGRRKRSRWSHIADKLLGYRLVMRGSVHFDWDESGNRVVGLITQADMIAPLLECLGSFEDVSLVFQSALIQPDCNLVIGEHLSQHQLCVY